MHFMEQNWKAVLTLKVLLVLILRLANLNNEGITFEGITSFSFRWMVNFAFVTKMIVTSSLVILPIVIVPMLTKIHAMEVHLLP